MTQMYKQYKVFKLITLPEEVQEYFDEEYTYKIGQEIFVSFEVKSTPDHDRGNGHVKICKWFVDNGAVKGEDVLIYLGE